MAHLIWPSVRFRGKSDDGNQSLARKSTNAVAVVSAFRRKGLRGKGVDHLAAIKGAVMMAQPTQRDWAERKRANGKQTLAFDFWPLRPSWLPVKGGYPLADIFAARMRRPNTGKKVRENGQSLTGIALAKHLCGGPSPDLVHGSRRLNFGGGQMQSGLPRVAGHSLNGPPPGFPHIAE